MAKYRVFANYVFSKPIGEFEADSEEEAIEKAEEVAEPDLALCCECSRQFYDSGVLDDDSYSTELLDE